MAAFRDDFDGVVLDPDNWNPHYRPNAGTPAGSPAHPPARHRVSEGRLRLWIPPDQPMWSPEGPPAARRVSGVASSGWLPTQGSLAVVCRMELSDRAMASVWLNGSAETAARSGGLCLVEVFGKDRVPRRSAAVGMGVRAGNDPQLTADFEAPRLEIDVGQWHEYAVRWDSAVAEFSVDGEHVRTCARPPTYPMQVMMAVFDYPEWFGDAAVPALEIDWIGGEWR